MRCFVQGDERVPISMGSFSTCQIFKEIEALGSILEYSGDFLEYFSYRACNLFFNGNSVGQVILYLIYIPDRSFFMESKFIEEDTVFVIKLRFHEFDMILRHTDNYVIRTKHVFSQPPLL